MAKRNQLTDSECRSAKPREKPYKLADVRGLYLLVNPNGAKWWRLRFSWQGKDQLLSLGVYPEVRRRFASGLRNFDGAYKSAVDDWAKYDNLGESPILLEWGENS